MIWQACVFLVAIGGLEALTVTKSPVNTGVILGENATMHCTVTNIQAGESVIWKKLPSSLITLDSTSQNIAKYKVEGTYNLVLMNAQLTDEAMYECEAGGTQYAISLTVGIAMRSLQLYWPGNLNTVRLNMVQNMTCKSEYSRPPATFRWFRDNVEVTNQATTYNGTVNSDGYGDSYSYMSMTVTAADVGKSYRCEGDVPGRRNALNQTLTIQAGVAATTYSLTLMIGTILATVAMSSKL